MEFKDKIKEIKIEFSGDALEMYDKLNFIMCTSRYKYLNIDDPPNETTLLFNLLYSDAMYIREVYYTPSIEFSKEVKDKAKIYADYLNRRKIGFTFQECVKYFFNYEIEKSLSDRAALYYPDFKAFVRCGDIDPKQLFELLAKEHCDRVIIFNGICPDIKNRDEEAFYSFEMIWPKADILKHLEETKEIMMEKIRKILNSMWK